MQKAGASTGRLPIGVNLVNEIWNAHVEMEKAWGILLVLPFVGDMPHLDEKSIENEIEAVFNEADAKMEPLRVGRKDLEARTMNNLSLIRY